MRTLSNTQDIFQQLADTTGSDGVKVVIENHDAWVHSETVDDAMTAVLRIQCERASRDPGRFTRIDRQRKRLASLITTLRTHISSAI